VPVVTIAPVVPPHAVHAAVKATPPVEKVLTAHAVAAPLLHQEPAAHGTGAELETTHVEPAAQVVGVVTPDVGQKRLTVHGVHAEDVIVSAPRVPIAHWPEQTSDDWPVAPPNVPAGHAVTAVALATQ